MAQCRTCRQAFDITEDDRAFFLQMNVPDPTMCPSCRMQLKLTFRNERTLYKRTCDFSGKQIISVYSPDSPYTVYDYREWSSDKWNALDYGRDVDFNRPFFEQFAELERVVPKTSLLIRDCENSDYVNNDEGDKNCYMTFASGFIEDCYYGRTVLQSKDCVDCLNLYECELCYECTNATKCYHCLFSQNINNCSDLLLCDQMIGSSECIACTGLRQKKYCVFNVQYKKEEYDKMKRELLAHFSTNRPHLEKRFAELRATVPMRYASIVNSESCTGDYVNDSKGCTDCFDVVHCQDCKNIWDAQKVKNCQDMMIGYQDELVYNTMGIALNSYMCKCSAYCWGCQEITYCQHCFNSKYLFGCVGLQKNQYCILNKQYTKEEYEKLVPKIIEHMQKNGEWGEYFPASLSPFAYNETMAQDYFPLTPAQAAASGFRWKQDAEGQSGKESIRWNEIPQEIEKVPDSITEEILACETCKRNFRIVPQELAFYRAQGLPLPHSCYNCRNLRRLAMRNPRKLWKRQCMNCSKDVETSYAPGRPEKIYCETCYQKEMA
jgi:hypothetical protein